MRPDANRYPESSGRNPQPVDFQKRTHKHGYVLASHSHFTWRMSTTLHVEKSPGNSSSRLDCRNGWSGVVSIAQRRKRGGGCPNYVYGYLLGAVSIDGSVHFESHEVTEQGIPDSVRKIYSNKFVRSCFVENKSPVYPGRTGTAPSCP